MVRRHGAVTFRFTDQMIAFRDEVRSFLVEQAATIGPRQFFQGRGGRTRAHCAPRPIVQSVIFGSFVPLVIVIVITVVA